MSLTKLTDNLNNVSSLPDKPTLDADELKAVFDESGKAIKEYINTILTAEIDNIVKDILSKISNNTLDIATKMSKSGDTMLGNLDMKGNAIQWKEEGYGDKFRIVPNFGGSGDNNILVIQSTVGEAGEDPTNWKDLVYIHADTGEINLIGKITGVDYYGKVCGQIMDFGAENGSDAWLLVMSNGSIQHRTIDNIVSSYSLVQKVDGNNIHSNIFTAYDQITNYGTLYNNGEIRSLSTYNYKNVSNAPNMYVTSDGWFRRTTGSSKRWKTDITEQIEDRLNPKVLYNLPIKQFKYKDDCISDDDVRKGKNILGFIAEDVAEVYEPAVQYDEQGQVEMWNAQVMIPAMLKLIQEQNERIKVLEEKVLN